MPTVRLLPGDPILDIATTGLANVAVLNLVGAETTLQCSDQIGADLTVTWKAALRGDTGAAITDHAAATNIPISLLPRFWRVTEGSAFIRSLILS